MSELRSCRFYIVISYHDFFKSFSRVVEVIYSLAYKLKTLMLRTDAHRHREDHHALIPNHVLSAGTSRGGEAHILHADSAGDGESAG